MLYSYRLNAYDYNWLTELYVCDEQICKLELKNVDGSNYNLRSRKFVCVVAGSVVVEHRLEGWI